MLSVCQFPSPPVHHVQLRSPAVRLTVLDDVLHLLPDSERQVAQVSWHMNQSSRSLLWIRLWALDSGRTFRSQNCSGFGSEPERPETGADHSPFHWDWKLLQNKHTIYHQELNQSSINQPMIWNQTFRKQTSLAFIISSMSLIVCERAEMCVFISSSFSFILCAVTVASSSSLRNWWSFSNCCLIWRSVCSAWDWNQSTFTSIISIDTHH